jgi:hypothetical protein
MDAELRLLSVIIASEKQGENFPATWTGLGIDVMNIGKENVNNITATSTSRKRQK